LYPVRHEIVWSMQTNCQGQERESNMARFLQNNVFNAIITTLNRSSPIDRAVFP
jgi:hypothetical protein